MPSCKKCHIRVISANLICHDCEAEDVKTAAALREAICANCGFVKEKHQCCVCRAMLLLDKLTGKTE